MVHNAQGALIVVIPFLVIFRDINKPFARFVVFDSLDLGIKETLYKERFSHLLENVIPHHPAIVS